MLAAMSSVVFGRWQLVHLDRYRGARCGGEVHNKKDRRYSKWRQKE
jgi:hypothetical protein